LVRGERLPGLEIDGQWRFRRDDVVDWLEQKIQTLDTARVSELEAKMESSLLADGIFRTVRTDRLTSRLPLKGIALGVSSTTKSNVLQSLTDGTSLFFLLCAPDDRSHLHGLARLARILHGGTLDILKAAVTAEDIVAALADVESKIQTRA
jgi:hypothetical protein